jgi:hypothetical protein
MAKRKLSAMESIILVAGIIVLAAGFFLYFADRSGFDQYVQEDGIVEWITVAGLLAGSIVCFSRFKKLFFKRGTWFLVITVFLALFLFFSSGEEISWGQRIFGIKSPEYFEKNNAQHETNLHNLVVSGVKINKLVFSLMLVIGLCVYLAILPVLYQKNFTIKKALDAAGVPVPQLYQAIGFLVLFVLTSLIPHGKKAELLEGVGSLLFFLIMLYPKNKEIFDTNYSR